MPSDFLDVAIKESQNRGLDVPAIPFEDDSDSSDKAETIDDSDSDEDENEHGTGLPRGSVGAEGASTLADAIVDFPAFESSPSPERRDSKIADIGLEEEEKVVAGEEETAIEDRDDNEPASKYVVPSINY